MTLARDLLAEDGVILVSINDDQRARLELMLDEALPGMKIGSFVWRTRQGSNADHDAFMSSDHEHILIYGHAGFRFAGNEKSFDMYKHFDEQKNDWFRLSDLTLGFSYIERPNLAYGLKDPSSDIWYPSNPNRVWVYPSKKRSKSARTKFMEDWIAAGHIRFPDNPKVMRWDTLASLTDAVANDEVPKSGNTQMIHPNLPDFGDWVGRSVGFGTPSFKRYKNDLRNPTQPLSSWITPNSEANTITTGANAIVSGTNDEAAKVIKSVFGSKAFNYAKPVSLIRELTKQSTDHGDIVLDFFAGSATTAQAVMELNAEDGGDRKFIMVSSTEATESDPDKNLCRDITAERIRLLNASEDKKYTDLSAGFAYLRTKEILFEDLDYDLAPKDAWTALEAMHRLPQTQYDTTQPWNAHEAEGVILVLIDRFEPELLEWLQARSRQNVFVYAWAPGQVSRELGGLNIEVRSVRDTLMRSFQQ